MPARRRSGDTPVTAGKKLARQTAPAATQGPGTRCGLPARPRAYKDSVAPRRSAQLSAAQRSHRFKEQLEQKGGRDTADQPSEGPDSPCPGPQKKVIGGSAWAGPRGPEGAGRGASTKAERRNIGLYCEYCLFSIRPALGRSGGNRPASFSRAAVAGRAGRGGVERNNAPARRGGARRAGGSSGLGDERRLAGRPAGLKIYRLIAVGEDIYEEAGRGGLRLQEDRESCAFTREPGLERSARMRRALRADRRPARHRNNSPEF